MRDDALQHRRLDPRVLDHRLDDPVALGEPGEIIAEVAGSYALRIGWQKKRRGSGFERPLDGDGGQAVAHCRIGKRQPSGGFVVGQGIRGAVEQQHLETGIGQVGSNCRAHDPGAENSYAADGWHISLLTPGDASAVTLVNIVARKPRNGNRGKRGFSGCCALPLGGE